MSYKTKGIERPTIKSCASSTQGLLGLKKPVKPRKERAKETKPRNREEAEFRKEVVQYLRFKGYYVKRIENSICNKLGNDIPDIVFFTKKYMVWLELKSKNGVLSPGQCEFRDQCLKTKTKYIVARNINDIERIITDVYEYEYPGNI